MKLHWWILCAAVSQPPAIAQQSRPLFRPVPAVRMKALNERGPAANLAPRGPAIKRWRLVEIEMPLIDLEAAGRFAQSMNRPGAPERIELNLFDDVSVTVVLRRVGYDQGGRTLVWRGDIEGAKPGTMTLASSGGTVNRKVALQDGSTYEIRPVAGNPGLQQIVELDPARLPRELPPVPVTRPPGNALDLPPAVDDGSVIDVMVAYTVSAREAAGGVDSITNLIAIGKAELNDGLAASDILFRVRVVHSVEVSFDDWLQFRARAVGRPERRSAGHPALAPQRIRG